jgi:hypothetical protein
MYNRIQNPGEVVPVYTKNGVTIRMQRKNRQLTGFIPKFKAFPFATVLTYVVLAKYFAQDDLTIRDAALVRALATIFSNEVQWARQKSSVWVIRNPMHLQGDYTDVFVTLEEYPWSAA